MSESELKINSLKRKYMSNLSEVKSIYEASKEAINDPEKVNRFKGMYKFLEKHNEKCTEYWDELYDLHEAQGKATEFPDRNFAAYQTAIKRYFEEANTNYEIILTRKSEIGTTPGNLSLNETHFSTHLPKMNLPQFSGELIQWPKFRDAFVSLIHDDSTIPAIRKFHYLITSVSGSALTIVNKLPLTSDNYPVAWKALVDTYDNKRILASAYLNELINFKPQHGKPSVSSLRLFLTKISENISAFKLLSIANESDFILYYLAIKCLDSQTREQFEIENQKTEFPTFDILSNFVRGRCLALQLSEQGQSTSNPLRSQQFDSASRFTKTTRPTIPVHKNTLLANKSVQNPLKSTETAVSFKPQKCPVCGQQHKLLDCLRFTEATVVQRVQWLKSWTGCHNCLSASHSTKNCASKWHCRFCDYRHHSLLHLVSQPKRLETKTEPTPQKDTSNNEASQALTSVANSNCQVLLGTALAKIKDATGHFKTVRMVIDSGSQSSFITQKCIYKLGLTIKPHPRTITGIGGCMLEGAKGQVACLLGSNCDWNAMLNTEAIVVSKITSDLPTISVPEEIRNEYIRFTLADPTFWKPGPIDFLLGSDLYAEIMTGTPITIHDDWPKLFPTLFGHVIIGRFTDRVSSSPTTSLFINMSGTDLKQELHNFWELEEPILQNHVINPDDETCEQHFVNTHYRNDAGQYVVRLPFKTGKSPELGSSFPVALKRFQNLENKLLKHDDLKQQYGDFMLEYLELNHMTSTISDSKYVIPHHSVTKMDRSQVKLRVVFDASATTSKGSLNDHLLAGPKLQTDIKDILLGFRIHPIVFVCDTVKMYRNILVDPQDRCFQHILWRFNPEDKIEKYELNTVTYGLTCAPFLALRTIQQLKEDEGHKFPKAAKVICRDMYVDDLVTGAETLDEALDLQSQVIKLMKKGGFSLSKWASNRMELIHSVNQDTNNEPITLDSKESGIKILGLVWKPNDDCFSYCIKDFPIIYTKRCILSTIAKLYDPLGFISPVIVKAKIIIQDLWKTNVGWDDDIPSEIKYEWKLLVDQLHLLSNLNIRRFISKVGSYMYQVVGFCDASEKAYSAAIYLITSTDESTSSMLLIAKNKLAPVKTISIPRLELCGALLLSKLYCSIKPFLALMSPDNSRKAIFFTDSSVTLNWINTPAFKLKTFVANRVTKILESTDTSSWYHVRSGDNTSDCSSRGIYPKDLLEHNSWWHGPSWLLKSQNEWPVTNLNEESTDLPELKGAYKDNSNVLLLTEEEPYFLQWIRLHSSFIYVVHVLAWVQRFISNSKPYSTKISGPLLKGETDKSLSTLIKLIQQHYFQIDHNEVSKYSATQRFINLSPFFDEEGILRVGGRLKRASITVEQKHPILLPNKCHFSTLLIDYYHKIHLHPGPGLLQALIQLKFWIPNLRRLVRHRVFMCLTCYKSKAKANSQIPQMSDLPQFRVEKGRAFLHTGVDFAGPFQLKESLRRKAAIGKAYLCLFVCMVTKAVHLELVTDLSTEAFLASFARFTSRRGLPTQMYSDCGTNFVGAANQMKQFCIWFREENTQRKIIQYATNQGVSWNFNPPNAPHFGGLWESNIKSAKRIITKTAGNVPMTYEELSTLFAKTEAVLNSRPLHPLSGSPEEINYLSPGHFLVGTNLSTNPEPTLLDCKDNTLSRWQLVKKMSEYFWKKWSQEYLCTLQQRPKWLTPQKNLQKGDLVILKDPQAPVLQWPTARIIDVHPGKDGNVRVVTVRTNKSSTYQRPVVQVVPLLPLQEDPYK